MPQCDREKAGEEGMGKGGSQCSTRRRGDASGVPLVMGFDY